METYSRRDFLKFTGIAVAGSQINFLPTFQQAAMSDSFQGRALAAVPVYSTSGVSSSIKSMLWPDSVVAITSVENDWYGIGDGYVAREYIQPMTPHLPQQQIRMPEKSFWAEVSGAVAPVREFCAANAPKVTRIGHGGVARIVDYLPGEPNGWYGIGDAEGNLIGWSQAIYWQPVDDGITENGDHQIRIDTQRQYLTALENGEVVLQAPCSIGERIKTGNYRIAEQQPSGQNLQIENVTDTIHGIPWVTTFADGYTLTGAYWHNQFGKSISGSSIQVTPLLAHWLYGWLNQNSRIGVI